MTPRTIPTIGLACLLAGAACSGPLDSESSAIVLEGVHIVDVDAGIVHADKSVLIEAGRVVQVGDAPGAGWPAAAERPNVRGQFLSPALYDLHVHVFDERDLRLYALSGIQAVRNMDGWEWHLRLRDTAPAGGPRARLFTSGGQLQKPRVATPADAAARVAADRAAGYDWIKLYDAMNAEQLAAVAAAANGAIGVSGHLPKRLVLSTVLATGAYDDIAHAEELLNAMRAQYPDWEAALEDVATIMRREAVALTTTIVNNKMIAEQVTDIEANLSRPETAYAPPLLQAFWRSAFNPWSARHAAGAAEKLAGDVAALQRMTAMLHARGVKILAGTDAPNPTTVPAFALHQELVLLVEAGLSPLDALRSATTHAADHLQPEARGARIEPGAAADFILTRDDPLDEISALADFDALIVDGVYLSRDSVDAERDALRAAYARDLIILSHLSPQSPAAVFDAIDASAETRPISSEGLTSLVWFYVKVANLDAALAVAERLAVLYPSVDSDFVRDDVARLIEQRIQTTGH